MMVILVVLISIFYAFRLKNVQFKYMQNTSDILVNADDGSINSVIGNFIWEYRGFEIIILAFILLCVYAGISVQIKKFNER